MNLFVLDASPEQAAKWHCDNHVGKMILETAQILCAPFHLRKTKAPYKLTHKNHPCAIWVRQSFENFDWAVRLGLALNEEKIARYGTSHKSAEVIKWCEENSYLLAFPQTGLTTFVQAMPEEYRGPDAIQAYRKYYKLGKAHLHKWKLNKPDWI